jgi:hypothetical protein
MLAGRALIYFGVGLLLLVGQRKHFAKQVKNLLKTNLKD